MHTIIYGKFEIALRNTPSIANIAGNTYYAAQGKINRRRNPESYQHANADTTVM